jgi:hypothetical protein
MIKVNLADEEAKSVVHALDMIRLYSNPNFLSDYDITDEDRMNAIKSTLNPELLIALSKIYIVLGDAQEGQFIFSKSRELQASLETNSMAN